VGSNDALARHEHTVGSAPTIAALNPNVLTRFTLAFVLLGLASCGATPVTVEVTGEPTLYQARVVAARGPTMAENGSVCSVEVQSADGATLNCRIRIRCNDDLVYGLSGAGYNNCRRAGERFIFAHDTAGTRRDGDPRMFFDLEAGRIIISDDDPDVEVLVDLMNRPTGYTPH